MDPGSLEGNLGGSCDTGKEGLYPPAGIVLPAESPQLSCRSHKGVASVEESHLPELAEMAIF